MLMAARKMQGIGLVLLVLLFAMILYPVSLKVAAERSKLAEINREIARTSDNIRYLESELAVRASMRQLEQWNADSFGYSAPSASQYLSTERELASIGRLPRARGANDVAPVLMAMAMPVALDDAKAADGKEAEAATTAKPAPASEQATDAAGAPPRRKVQLSLIEDQLLAQSTLAQAAPAKTAAKPAEAAQRSDKPKGDRP